MMQEKPLKFSAEEQQRHHVLRIQNGACMDAPGAGPESLWARMGQPPPRPPGRNASDELAPHAPCTLRMHIPAALPPVGSDIPVSGNTRVSRGQAHPCLVSHRFMDSAPDSYPVVNHSFLFSKANVELQGGRAANAARTPCANTTYCALTQLHDGRSTPGIPPPVSAADAAGGHDHARAAPYAAYSIAITAPNAPGEPHPQKSAPASTPPQPGFRPRHVARITRVTCAEWFPVCRLHRLLQSSGQQWGHDWLPPGFPVGVAGLELTAVFLY